MSFQLPAFYPVLDTTLFESAGLPIIGAAQTLIETGVRILQYRHKLDWHQRHYDEAAAIAQHCEQAGVLFILNDRADFAKLLRCGLHLGQDDLPVSAARSVIGDEVLGYSTHNHRQLQAADRQAVEYISLGPIFATSSKLDPDPVVGLEQLTAARQFTAKPICAIGGITVTNARQVLTAGANSVAVLSGLLPTPVSTLKQQAQQWLQQTAA